MDTLPNYPHCQMTDKTRQIHTNKTEKVNTISILNFSLCEITTVRNRKSCSFISPAYLQVCM